MATEYNFVICYLCLPSQSCYILNFYLSFFSVAQLKKMDVIIWLRRNLKKNLQQILVANAV